MHIAAMQPRGVIPGFLVVRPFHANECPEFIRVRIRQVQHDTSANRTPDQSGLIQRERVAECQYRFNVKLRRQSILLVLDRKKHTSELQSLMRISYAVFCLKKKT